MATITVLLVLQKPKALQFQLPFRRYVLWPCSDVQLHSLPFESQLAEWEFAVSQHSVVPQGVLDIIQSMPHDAHPMGVLVNSMSALSIFHPDANPALRVSNKNCWQVTLVLDCLCIDHISKDY
ncbi:hypothetical protein Fmac_008635 [Flemingia macrophylla]|uniref:Uncharacterized protein n=1 Tax=Flemingia macrophylla TaxID=520843 RepID=A0ABD1MXY0_9FABA